MRKGFENIKNITLRGKRYKINLVTRLGSDKNPIYGLCSPPDEPGRCISYYIGLKGSKRLDVIIHEMLHACFWDIAEEGIQDGATDIANALWRMGYRMYHDEEFEENQKEVNHVVIRGKRYLFERVTTREVWFGSHAHSWIASPYQTNKFIKVKKGIKKETELQAILRGLLTACYWDMDESAIRQTAKDIGHALWRIGYRKQEKDV